jgi:hypothetical protein
MIPLLSGSGSLNQYHMLPDTLESHCHHQMLVSPIQLGYWIDDAETASSALCSSGSGSLGTMFSKGPIGKCNVVVLPAPMELKGVIQA